MMNYLNNLVLGTISKEIYNPSGANDPVNSVLMKIIKNVGGWGGSVLVLMIMVLAILIFFASPSPRMRTALWTGLGICLLAAIVFFSAYIIGPGMKNYF